MKVLFKSISIKNFLSIGQEPVVIHFKPGLHIITGVNKDKEDRRNGVGKSAVADAIYFAVFGNTLRELNKEFIPNNITKYNCEVILEFSSVNNNVETEYKVVRTLEPSRCEFYINGEDKTRDSIINTTAAIIDILKTSPEIFENCVLMSVNNTVPFMAKKKVEKRKFIESIFGLEVFSRMLGNLKGEASDARREFEVVAGKYEEVNKSLDTFKRQQESFATDRLARFEKLSKKKTGNVVEIEQIQQKIIPQDSSVKDQARATVEKFETNSKLCDERISAVEKLINQNEVALQFKQSQQTKIGTDKDKCPVCLKAVTDTDQAHFKAEKERILNEVNDLKAQNEQKNKSLNDLQELRSKLRANIKKQNDIITQFNLKEQENKNNTERIKQLQSWNNEIDSEVRTLTDQTLQLKDDSKELKDRLEVVRKQLDESKKKIAIYDTVRFVISEEGVKSSIVKKMLQLFNSKIAYYLKMMDSNCVCVFNEYFEEEIMNEKGIPCSYFNFSGAERKSIDFACLFAFMDLRRLQGGVSYNISLYDELFDSSVDEKGLELVLSILRERVQKYNESVIIVSHRKESVKAVTGDVIMLEKSNGITRKVDYIEEQI